MIHRIILLTLLACIAAAPVSAKEKEGAGAPDAGMKKVRLEWEKATGAVQYEVQLADEEGKITARTRVDVPACELSVKPGKYRLRIGVVNKFRKIYEWSDWEKIEVIQATEETPPPTQQAGDQPAAEKKKQARKKITRPEFGKVKIGAGWGYQYLLPKWGDILQDSYIDAGLTLGIYLGGFNALKKNPFCRYFGFEFDLGFARYTGLGSKTIDLTLDAFQGGMNLFVRTAFTAPANLIVRAGGGAVYTMQELVVVDIYGAMLQHATLSSVDLYCKGGVALEIYPVKHFFMEFGAEFQAIFYQKQTFYCIRPVFVIGTTF